MRTSAKTTLQDYFAKQEELLRLQSEFITGSLPHNATRGQNDEEILREFLRRCLPKKYSVGTGFVICNKKHVKPSSQIDIVIYDEQINFPIHRELVSSVFPIESVYATIEVKGLIAQAANGKRPRKTDLQRSLESIARIRRMAKHKTYAKFGSIKLESGTKNVNVKQFKKTLPPRSYIFAFRRKGWRAIGDCRDSLSSTLRAVGDSHLHGLIILNPENKSWFLNQISPAAINDGIGLRSASPHGPVIHTHEGEVLSRFLYHLTLSLNSMPMYPIALDKYLDCSFPY